MYKMVNYGNGKIYKVICSETGSVYIGSTTVTLSRRMTNHRAPNNRCMTKDFIDGKIFLIEDYPCERKEQLESRERFHIESNDCVNLVIPTRTKKEYFEANKETIIKYKKKHYQDNKECIKQTHKEWYENNRENVLKRMEQNKEKLREKFDCECGGKYTHEHKASHKKTNKHQAYLSSII